MRHVSRHPLDDAEHPLRGRSGSRSGLASSASVTRSARSRPGLHSLPRTTERRRPHGPSSLCPDRRRWHRRLSVAARLRNARPGSVALVEPSEKHYYQPLWTLVGGGVFAKEITRDPRPTTSPTASCGSRTPSPRSSPTRSRSSRGRGERIGYEQLVVALGIQLDWEQDRGPAAALGKDGIVLQLPLRPRRLDVEALQSIDGGNAIFTFPSTPVKCAGAPQKIMYLADDHLRKRGVRDEDARHLRIGRQGDLRRRALREHAAQGRRAQAASRPCSGTTSSRSDRPRARPCSSTSTTAPSASCPTRCSTSCRRRARPT